MSAAAALRKPRNSQWVQGLRFVVVAMIMANGLRSLKMSHKLLCRLRSMIQITVVFAKATLLAAWQL
jgi:chromate transport protein ChrA